MKLFTSFWWWIGHCFCAGGGGGGGSGRCRNYFIKHTRSIVSKIFAQIWATHFLSITREKKNTISYFSVPFSIVFVLRKIMNGLLAHSACMCVCAQGWWQWTTVMCHKFNIVESFRFKRNISMLYITYDIKNK